MYSYYFGMFALIFILLLEFVIFVGVFLFFVVVLCTIGKIDFM